MANILIPERFKIKLEKNQALDGIVKTTQSTFGNLLEESKLFFFNEYTNHGIKHIQDVLLSSDSLITDDTYSGILSDKDIGYYILSVILHDIGMHIDLEGFKCLINGDYDDIQIKEFDNYTWSELWEDYINESQKFSGNQLKSIFGDENTIVRIPPFTKPGDITENDKKLIGEFIRRHHSRLAHEIAIKGFPAKPHLLEFANALEPSHLNLIGLIARSHGIGLRDCLDYIEAVYGKNSRRFPNGVHATYLMVLLRISDYIQIDSSRTSETTLKTKTFYSPTSVMEHNTHLAIDNIDFKWNDDPEKIFVFTNPKDSKMFLKLKKLIKDIQFEFDMSWAVLGELYGKGNDRDKAEIKYRRISSNLEDKQFIDKQNYIADSFAFKANDEIIKLLIAPLYGDNPTYGVRELLQNAVDACKERETLEKKRGNKYTPLVTIEIEKEADNSSYFKITDNGIGMDSDVIKNYFLSAGASYRRSYNWQKEFLNNTGKSTVRRSGRFGVGILSAFLIGEEIEVRTHKIDHNDGYGFKANINDEQIDIVKDITKFEGTKIKIRIDEKNMKNFIIPENEYVGLPWYKWYTLSSPKVEYFIYGEQIIPYSNLNPDCNDTLPKGWHIIDSEGYNKIMWSYYKQFVNVDFACNGIVIPHYQNNSDNHLDLRLILSYPQISIFDNNANLPLTLDRNSFSDSLTFRNELLIDLYKDLIAYLLIFNRNSYIENKKIFSKSNKLNHPSSIDRSYSHFIESRYGKNNYKNDSGYYLLQEFMNTILTSNKGFILNYNYFIRKLNSINAIFMQCENLPDDGFEFDLQDRFILLNDNKINSIEDYKNAIEAMEFNSETNTFDSINSRIYLKSDKYKFLFKSDKKRVSLWLNNKCQFKFEKYGFTCLELDVPKPSIISDAFLKKNEKNLHFIREYEIICPFEGDALLNSLLEKYIGDDVIIPFNVEDRKKKYPLAFEELKGYMEKYLDPF